jgi:hypothetical protein
MRTTIIGFLTILLLAPSLGHAVGQNTPSDQKKKSGNQKATPATPSGVGLNPKPNQQQPCAQAQPTQPPCGNSIPKVEITPNPLVVAPQSPDTWFKWYVILTGAIALFAGAAAVAAVIQARATQQKERAWLVAIMERVPDSLVQPPPSTETRFVTGIYRLACTIENKGNSPAWINEWAARLQVVPAQDDWTEELPTTPDYGEVTRVGDFGATMPPNAMLPITRLLDPQDAAAVERGERALYFYGKVKYRDAFRKRRETRFCFRLKVALGLTDPASRGFYIAGPREYNKAT